MIEEDIFIPKRKVHSSILNVKKREAASNKRDRWPYSGKDINLNMKEGHRETMVWYTSSGILKKKFMSS